MPVVTIVAGAAALIAVVATLRLVTCIAGLARAEPGTVESQERRGAVWRSSGVLLLVAALTGLLVSEASLREFPPLTPVMVGLGGFSIIHGSRIRVAPPPPAPPSSPEGPARQGTTSPQPPLLPGLGGPVGDLRPPLQRRGLPRRGPKRDARDGH